MVNHTRTKIEAKAQDGSASNVQPPLRSSQTEEYILAVVAAIVLIDGVANDLTALKSSRSVTPRLREQLETDFTELQVQLDTILATTKEIEHDAQEEAAVATVVDHSQTTSGQDARIEQLTARISANEKACAMQRAYLTKVDQRKGELETKSKAQTHS